LINNTQVDLYIHRDNPTLLFEYITNLQKNIFIILLAINNEYFPTFKWMYKALESFKFKPENIEQRFREVYNCSPAKAVESSLSILNETFEIINKLYPKINTKLVLNKLKSTRMSFVNPIENI
jgi:hypothetical protein